MNRGVSFWYSFVASSTVLGQEATRNSWFREQLNRSDLVYLHALGTPAMGLFWESNLYGVLSEFRRGYFLFLQIIRLFIFRIRSSSFRSVELFGRFWINFIENSLFTCANSCFFWFLKLFQRVVFFCK